MKNGSTVLERPEMGLHSLDLNEQANDGPLIEEPYRMRFKVEGTAPILFHRFDCEEMAPPSTTGGGTKGGVKKKTDNVESYYYRDDKGFVCVPAEGVHGALISAGRWFQDPRSSRKTAMDLVKAGVIVEPNRIQCLRNGKPLKTCEYEDKRRVQVNRAGIARVRPALNVGWQAEFEVMVLASDLIAPRFLRELMAKAGTFCGWCDFRPQYGRFQVLHAEVLKL